LSLLLKDSLLAADLTITGSFFYLSIYLTANEYFLGSVLANCAVRPFPPAFCLVPALSLVLPSSVVEPEPEP
jgi:hypothetical protein